MRNELIAVIAAKHLPAAAGAAGIVLLGVPAGVLLAALLGATLSFYFRKGEEEPRIGRVVFGIVAMAYTGAWVALALPAVGPFGIGEVAGNVDLSVRAGLCALLIQSLWNLGHRFFDRKVEGR